MKNNAKPPSATTQGIRRLILTGLIFATSGIASAQTTVTEKTVTTNTVGTISEFGGNTIVIKSESAPEPMRYVYTKQTTYLDEQGQPVSVETVKSGLPVTVYYTKDGDRMVATRVVVRRAAVAPAPAGDVIEKRTTTTTTTGGRNGRATVETATTSTTQTLGVVNEFGTDSFVIRAEGAKEPVRYSYSKTTTYTDEDGNPVSVETVKSGLPVTVYYTKEGDRMVANRVVVRKMKTTREEK